MNTPNATLIHSDCLAAMRALPDNSVDLILTDPPYGLGNTSPAQVTEALTAWLSGDREYLPSGRGFMGKEWDAFVPPVAVWDEALRVLKPGGHVLAAAGSRTQDLMALAIRLGGFELRDVIAWLYGSGFPKSLDVSKAIDKRGGNAHLAPVIGEALKAARTARGMSLKEADLLFCGGSSNWSWFEGRPSGQRPPTPETFAAIAVAWPELAELAETVSEANREVIGASPWSNSANHFVPGEDHTGRVHLDITAPATDAAKRWAGWGTALKPAYEPFIMARKPLEGTVAANVLKHGTGALNIDASRIGTETRTNQPAGVGGSQDMLTRLADGKAATGNVVQGRFPANVILDESQAAVLDEQSGWSKSPAVGSVTATKARKSSSMSGALANQAPMSNGHGDSGGASRFFQVIEPDSQFLYTPKAGKRERPVVDGVAHPTVKPLKLLQYLAKLACPPGGVILDPFAGSGTTIEAALLEGFNVIGIEREADYIPLIEARIARVQGTDELASAA